MHTTTPNLRLLTSVTADRVRVFVYDEGATELPAAPAPAGDSESGRGLLLVDALAADWGAGYPSHAPPVYGKRVWFELRTPRPAAPD